MDYKKKIIRGFRIYKMKKTCSTPARKSYFFASVDRPEFQDAIFERD